MFGIHNIKMQAQQANIVTLIFVLIVENVKSRGSRDFIQLFKIYELGEV